MILRNFISLLAFTVYTEKSLWFEILLWSICTEVSCTTPEVMWMLIMKLPRTEVKFYPKVKSRTGLSSLRDKISLRCEVTLLSVFTWLCAEWNSLRCKFYFGQIDSLRFASPLLLLFRKQTIVQHLFCINSVWINYTKSFAHVQ